MEVVAIRRLVERTRIYKKEGERMSLVLTFETVFDADSLSLSVCIVVFGVNHFVDHSSLCIEALRE